MHDPVDALVLDLIEWVGRSGKPYRDVMEAWRTSCPRLPVWEEANSRGFVTCAHGRGEPARVVVTSAGWDYLESGRGRQDAPG